MFKTISLHFKFGMVVGSSSQLPMEYGSMVRPADVTFTSYRWHDSLESFKKYSDFNSIITSDIVENSSLNSFKSAVDNYFYDFKFMLHS